MKASVHGPAAQGEVNYMGDAVAVVVASDCHLSYDALEAINADYEPLEPVVDIERALAEEAPLVHEDLGTNEYYTRPPATGDIDEAFGQADVVASGTDGPGGTSGTGPVGDQLVRRRAYDGDVRAG